MTTDDDRQDGKKRGLFSRLFGRKQDEKHETPPPEDTTQAGEDETVPAAPQESGTASEASESPAPESSSETDVPTGAEPEKLPETTPHSAADDAAAGDDIVSDDDIPAEDEAGKDQPPADASHTPPDEPQDPPAIAQDVPVIAEEQPAPLFSAEPEPEIAPEGEPEPAAKTSWWQRLREGLSRTSSNIGSGITGIFTKRKLDFTTLEELEDILIQADLGVAMATRVTDALGKGRYDKSIDPEEVKTILAREIGAVLEPVARPLVIDKAKKPFVILMAGVNGAGKTTTIGKLAQKFRNEGRSVMLAAGDTFRAAAIEQLTVWGERTGARVIRREQGADAAGLAFDALKEAQNSNTDVLLIDTAGRLQNKAGLMAELEKIIRVIKKCDETAPHAVLLVLDATTGQNAVNQVEIFGQTAGVTGLVMTKLDGTARGGILVAIADKFGLPVHYIGVGEGVEDLEPFAADDFARAIAGLDHERSNS
ncbi:signal recognition particle-docking protein FtsY [Pseudochelatococcus contaminans]|uniref:Signal recognition particle receptor FtsY n=1 Tax=Pseudochelatococcus contaminans TaxID=1538103 RepID=A0A7W5Z2L7_9HYPH|nr:signal recognition particle-docking protein FtsY [Pseudochelatococcus contaminans]MBB3808844.1 fused signal recognition particle receptor [Pseudochelatococcus contaminans]